MNEMKPIRAQNGNLKKKNPLFFANNLFKASGGNTFGNEINRFHASA